MTKSFFLAEKFSLSTQIYVFKQLKNTGNPHKPKHKLIHQSKASDVLTSGLLRLQNLVSKTWRFLSSGVRNSERCFDQSAESSYEIYFLPPNRFLSTVLHISSSFYRFSEPANSYGKTENEIFSNSSIGKSKPLNLLCRWNTKWLCLWSGFHVLHMTTRSRMFGHAVRPRTIYMHMFPSNKMNFGRGFIEKVCVTLERMA